MTASSTLLLAAFLVALPAAASPPSASPLDERVSIDLKEADPGDALRSFSQLTGLKFTVDPALKTPFTASLRNVRVRTALDVLCESVGCSWKEIGSNPPSVNVVSTAPPGAATAAAATTPSADVPDQPSSLTRKDGDGVLDQPISLALNDAAASEVLKSFGQILLAEVVLEPPTIDGKVTINLQAVPVRVGLDGICAQLRCAWNFDTSGTKPVLRVRHSKKEN